MSGVKPDLLKLARELRQWPKLIPVGFTAFHPSGDFDVVAVGEGDLELMQLLLEFAQGTKHFVAVLFEDSAPEVRVAAGDACGVAEAAAGVIAPGRIFSSEKRTQA